MIKSWQALEEFAYDLIETDNPVCPAGSGNGKKEEDVVGDNVIIQCKYTEDKNTSILAKDLTRLLDACKLQDKFPLFITSNGQHTILSILIDKNTEDIIEDIVNLIIGETSLEKCLMKINTIKTTSNLFILEKVVNKIFANLNIIEGKIRYKLSNISKTIKRKYDDLTMYDLFEEVKNVL
jgi:hypothetical protein